MKNDIKVIIPEERHNQLLEIEKVFKEIIHDDNAIKAILYYKITDHFFIDREQALFIINPDDAIRELSLEIERCHERINELRFTKIPFSLKKNRIVADIAVKNKYQS